MYKNMHTLSFRKFEDETPEQRLAHQQTENLKWQQDMFHMILNKIGLQKEGIVSEEEVGTIRSDLLYALIASPAEGEWPGITRDKLLFLQVRYPILILCAFLDYKQNKKNYSNASKTFFYRAFSFLIYVNRIS